MITFATVRKLSKTCTDLRVQKDAVETLAEHVNDEVKTMIKRAEDIAKANHHKSISADDIKFAIKWQK